MGQNVFGLWPNWEDELYRPYKDGSGFYQMQEQEYDVWSGEILECVLECVKMLTTRQRDCFLLYVDRGMTMREIGKHIGIHRHTVRFHLENAYQRVRYALEQGGFEADLKNM